MADPLEMSVQFLLGFFKFFHGQLQHPSRGTDKESGWDDAPLLHGGFGCFNCLQRHGIQRQLEAMFIQY